MAWLQHNNYALRRYILLFTFQFYIILYENPFCQLIRQTHTYVILIY